MAGCEEERGSDVHIHAQMQSTEVRVPTRLFHIMLKLPNMPFSNAAKCSLYCH